MSVDTRAALVRRYAATSTAVGWYREAVDEDAEL